MPVDLTEVRQLFFEESFENLDVMESSLLDLEIGTVSKELVNSIFRAAHSIKGGAGIFKLEQIIHFAHVTETLLDEMRNGEHLITQSLIDLLLRSVDVMRMMLSALQENHLYDKQSVLACQNELQKVLKTPMAPTAVEEGTSTGEATSVTPQSTSQAVASEPASPSIATPILPSTLATNPQQGWHIVFKPDLSMLKTGNDPINLFRELTNLGQLDIKVDISQVPSLTDIDPQQCYLSWELILQTNEGKAAIEEIFEWVADESELHITPLTSSTVEKAMAATMENLTAALATVNPTTKELPESVVKMADNQPPAVEANPTVASRQIEEIEEVTTATVSHTPPFGEVTASKEPSKVSVSEEPKPSLATEEPSTSTSTTVELTTPIAPTTANSETALPTLKPPTSPTKPTSVMKERDNSKNGSVPTTAITGHHSSEANSIRVNIDKIDNLINLVGELVITQSMLDQIGENFDNSHLPQLRDGLSQLERNTRELQESVMRIRMLPISYSFNRFPRMVHDLSVQLGKKVELKLSGEHTELDKTVLEKMSDPLVHLVRNALDHGIESPDKRKAAGKSEIGQLLLHAYHQGGNIVIQISDDGAGFDLAKIRAKAIQKGLITSEEHLPDEQLYELIFLPGFSTAEQVSDLSGRGVGMDVVRRNIRALGGTIDIKSLPGKGSTFSIRLPLTLAILDGQLVRVGQEIYILPLLSIIESLRVKPSLVNSLAGKAEVYRLREEYIPVLRLYTLFEITPTTSQLDQGLLVIVEGDGQKIGLFVDELLSQQQIVIKSLETNYKQVQGVSGATILGDGSVALILDIAGLIQLFHRKTKTPTSRLQTLRGFHYE
jgi:two-component system chemotaxis sensor kinase CheA